MKRDQLVACFGKNGKKWLGYLVYVPCERVVVLRDSFKDDEKVVIGVHAISDVITYRKASETEIAFHEAVVREFDGINIMSFAI
ncbi:hypothetical protein PM116P6_00045 [Parabacteroides phage PM116P6]|nr:hypothetical protein PM116P6_00045 [Parabacteroides phage PM116P6]WAX17620.1 hypothetical protein PM116P7_00005 [Parabacteroides phage PM116P7]